MSPTSSPEPARLGASSPVWTLLRTELRMLARDRRTLIASVLLPILFMPGMFWLSHRAESGREKRMEEKTFLYAIEGSQAELARQLLAAAPSAEEEAAEEAAGGRSHAPLRLQESTVADKRAALDSRSLHVLVLAMTADEAAALRASEAAEPAGAATETNDAPTGTATDSTTDSSTDSTTDAATADLPVLRLEFQGDWDPARTAADALESRLAAARGTRQDLLLREAGFPIEREQVAAVAESRDLATAGQRGGRALGRFAVLAMLMFLVAGGSVVAADTLAGEKERGTLETLLTSAATRTEIVLGKLLVIVVVGLVITFIQVANLLVYVGLELIEIPANMAVDVSPLAAIWLVLLLLPLVVIVAGVLLLMSGRSKTYKEFQVNFFPVFVLLLAPAAAAMLPGIDLRSAVVLVPIANLAVAVREVLIGEIDWLFLPLALAVSSAAAWQLVRQTLRALQTERLVTAAEVDEAEFHGGPALFQRHVPVIFGLMWATIFLVANNVPALTGVRAQVLFNLVGVMFGAVLFALWKYRLDPRQALALRLPSPWAWPAVILGAPAFLLAAMAVAKLSNLLFPVPERMLEAFGQQLLPEDFPTWQIVVFLAILPGIFEELAFRGALLHGLRKRYRPWQLCLATGLVFGLFHMSLFRILPTASLGVALAAVTLLTGSIFPAMLWHALNNATALFLGQQGLEIGSLDTSVYVIASVVSVLCFGLLWRTRTPYPDLKRLPPRRAAT